MKIFIQYFFLCFFALALNAQDTIELPNKITVNGYVKSLQSLNFDKNFSTAVSSNLIHNRINIKWKPAAAITGVAELRNRFFWGEAVKVTPGFADQLRNPNEKINLQKSWINSPSLVLHTNVERLYADWRKGEWNVRIGRQRINWGITSTWNPNDIFNTYNFLDFDYEERPGIDGAKMEYAFNSSFKTEMAYAHTGKKNGTVAAMKYSLNQWNYDLQLVTGWYNEHPTIGVGWAGPIKDAGFKGEAQYFFGNKDSGDHLNIVLEADYMFKGGWYVNAGLLYNSHGLYRPVDNWATINLKLSPENLMPTKWNVMVTTVKEINPLFSVNASVLYAPGTNLLILLPSLQYNLATNVDAQLVWQSFFAGQQNAFSAVNHQCFLRLKWSF